MPTMQELRERLTAEQRPSLPENVRNDLGSASGRRCGSIQRPRRRPGGMWACPTPYGVDPLTDDSVGRECFARNPGSDGS